MSIVCNFGGRFHPPHPGHYSIYLKCKELFPNVQVVTSNKVEENSPFSFEDKKFIWNRMFNVDIKYSSNPTFMPKETLSPGDILVCATSEKDKKRYLHTKFFEPYSEGVSESWETRGYFLVLPEMANGASATNIRQNIKYNKELFEQIYGKFDQEVFDLINSRI